MVNNTRLSSESTHETEQPPLPVLFFWKPQKIFFIPTKTLSKKSNLKLGQKFL